MRYLGQGRVFVCIAALSVAVTSCTTSGTQMRSAGAGISTQRATRQAAATTAQPKHQSAARGLPPGLIVFEHDDRKMNMFIWAMTDRGTNPRPLTDGRGDVLDQEPTMSPNGHRVAFLRITGICRATCAHAGIWVMDSNGKNQHQIAPGDNVYRPAWSPTGKAIAAVKELTDMRTEIEVMDPSGAHLRVLPTHGLRQIGEPGWSPDGRRIAFTALEPSGRSDDLYTERADGTHLVRLTHSPGFKASPSWSPSGSQIVFAQARLELHPWHLRPWHLVVVRSNGTHPRQITTGRASAQFPHFASTGRWILYQRGTKASRAYVLHPDGTGNRPVSRTVEATDPTWQQVTERVHLRR